METPILNFELKEKACKNACKILGVNFDKIDNQLDVIKIYLALSQLMGGDAELMKHWIHTHNKHLKGKPIKHIEKTKTSDVLRYVESILFV
jgi:hypothetical protein